MSEFIVRHKIALQYYAVAQLVEQSCSYCFKSEFPVCLTQHEKAVMIDTSFGEFVVEMDHDAEVLTVTLQEARDYFDGYIKVRCVPDRLYPDTGMGIDLPIKCAVDLRVSPLRWTLPGTGCPMVIFTDKFGKHKCMEHERHRY